ncbi:MAG: TetR/AcrR family transcriptional regulator [Nocardioidaceae bacterium]|nr:TetR/AcrR family transcriptional regulator [Nocardioidaceae bacterium]
MSRREMLAEQVTDYVLEHGIIGLSLRPLAAALGTSDRMLVYHFGTRDALVAEAIELSNARSVGVLRGLRAVRSVRAGVLALWQVMSDPQVDRCQRVYAQAAALGLLGREPFADTVRRSNAEWMRAVADYLRSCGASPGRVQRIARLVDATMMGLQLDLSVEDSDGVERAIRDLARTAQRISDKAA